MRILVFAGAAGLVLMLLYSGAMFLYGGCVSRELSRSMCAWVW